MNAPIRQARVNLNDYPPEIASELRYSAREHMLADFWRSQERFNEAIAGGCPALEREVYAHIFDAMRFIRNEEKSLACLRLAKSALEEFVTEVVDDEYYRMALDHVEAE